LCPPPTDYVPTKFPDPERVEPFALARTETFFASRFRGFHPRLTLPAGEERGAAGRCKRRFLNPESYFLNSALCRSFLKIWHEFGVTTENKADTNLKK
jgi:hypothetical protein